MTLPQFSNPPPPIPLWRRRWAGPAAVAAAFLAMLIWTWQTWADVLVDFGVQLYVPWQLSQGKVLYRDIAHYTGPLSVYYNALAFHIFGVNLRVLELANFPILIGIIIAIYCLAMRLGGRLCAAACGISFVILFAFAHITIAGNYNFVCPYEYEYTHATLLCLGCLIFFARLLRRRKILDAAISGLLAGLVFLTRSEFFVALAAALAAGWILFAISNLKSLVRSLLTFTISAAVPFALSIAFLSRAMPLSQAAHGTLGMWPALLGGHVTAQRFYQHSMGLDDIRNSLAALSIWCCRYLFPIAIFLFWAMVVRTKQSAPHQVVAAVLGLGLLAAAYLAWEHKASEWISFFRPLPVVALAVSAIAIVQWRRSRENPDRQNTAALAAMIGLFSLFLLAKVFLYARIIHYGVWLAMPATMLLVIALFGWIPALLAGRGKAAPIFLSGIGGCWCGILVVHLSITGAVISTLKTPVGAGADQFRADEPRAIRVNNAIEAAEQIIPAGKSLACFPEGIMINYLARRHVPTRYVNFNPPDLLLFGEDQMLQALKDSPPDFIFIVHKNTAEFGETFFGRDYGQKLYAWIEANYQEQPLPMIDLGAEPLVDNRFGIRLLIPRPAPGEERRLIYGPSGSRKVVSTAAASTSFHE